MSLRRSVERIFSPQGSLSRVVERFEWRPQQAEMATTLADALTGGESWIIEAPTGVGKSLAYLVPGALWSRAEGCVLLVSTYTRHLQDQILRRDLPMLQRLTDRRIGVAVLKGRGNYLCRRRWMQVRAELSGTTDGEALVRTLEGWVQVTDSGDFDEGPPVAGRLRRLLARVASDARFCATSDCTAEDGCFFKLSRRRAREAQIVLVNHSLLVLELLAGGVGLPPWDGIVVDEAHHLPRVAAEALSQSISARSWRAALLGLGGQGEPGASDLARRLLRGWKPGERRSGLLERLREVEGELGRLLEASRCFFAELREIDGYPAAGGRARYRLGAGSGGSFPPSTYPLIEMTMNLLERHDGLLREIREPAEATGDGAVVAEIERDLDAARAACRTLTDLVEAGDAGAVYWIEDDPVDGALLRSRPLDLSGTLGERLDDGRPLILTSATLAVGSSTRFFANQCGLREGTRELILPSVFPLEEQVRVLAPRMIRDPNEEGHALDLAEAIRRLAVAIPRKILVLFTAHATLKRVREAIGSSLEDRGIWVYAQGRETSRSALSEAFRKSERAVLLGAASFWEGVDFPGEHLEILLMVRLPFPVPTDPFVEAYAERLREEGKDPFEAFMLPEAIVRFRQGFGRLIRRRNDRGIFAILDPRILSRGYGERFAQALGVAIHPVGSWEELVDQARGWFEAGGPPPEKEEEAER